MSDQYFYVKANNGNFVLAKFLNVNGQYIKDPNTARAAAAGIFSAVDQSPVISGNPDGFLIVPANYTVDSALAFASTLGSVNAYGGAAGGTAAYAAMVYAFVPGGPQDLQRSYPGATGGLGGAFVGAFTDATSFNFGMISAYSGVGVSAALVGGGLLNTIQSLGNTKINTDGAFNNNPYNANSINSGATFGSQLPGARSTTFFGVPLGSSQIDGGELPYNTAESASIALASLIYPVPTNTTGDNGSPQVPPDPESSARSALATVIKNQLSGLIGTFSLSESNDGSLLITGSGGAMVTLNRDLSGVKTVPTDSNGSFTQTNFSSDGSAQSTYYHTVLYGSDSAGNIIETDTNQVLDAKGNELLNVKNVYRIKEGEPPTLQNSSATQSDGSHIYTVFSVDQYGNPRAVTVTDDSYGNVSSISTNTAGQIATTTNTLDQNGILTGTTTVGPNGTSITTFDNPNDPNIRTTSLYATDGTLQSVSSTTLTVDGTYVTTLVDANGIPVTPPTIGQPGSSTSNAALLSGENGAVDLLQAIIALQHGNPIAAGIDGLQLAQALTQSTNLGIAVHAAGGIESVVGLIQSIHNGNFLGAIQNGASVATDGAAFLNALGQDTAFYNFLNGGDNALSQGVSSALNSIDSGLGNAAASVPVISFVDIGVDVAEGNYVGAAIAAVTVVNPVLGTALEVVDLLYNLLVGLFSGPAMRYISVDDNSGISNVSLGSDIEDTVAFSFDQLNNRQTTVELGTGNNIIHAGGGSLQLVMSNSAGRDTVDMQFSQDPNIGSYNLLFASEVKPSDVHLERSGNDMIFHVGSVGATLTVSDWFTRPVLQFATETFADGTVWDASTLQNLPVYQIGGSADTAFAADAGYGNVVITGNGNDTVNIALGATADVVGGNGDSLVNIGLLQADLNTPGTTANIATAAGNDTINIGSLCTDVLVDLGSGNNLVNFELYRDYASNYSLVDATVKLGSGSNVVNVGWGETHFVASAAFGVDTINIAGSSYGGAQNTIAFDSSVSASQVEFARLGQDMVLSLVGETGALTISNWYADDNLRLGVFTFADGTSFTADDLHGILIPYHGDGLLMGSIGDDDIYAGSGNDTLVTNGGDDHLHGGAGNDTFEVSAGSSALIFTGDGNDKVITDQNSTSTIHLGAGVDTVSVSQDTEMVNILGGTGAATIVLGDGTNQNYPGNVSITAGSGYENIYGHASSSGTLNLNYGLGDGTVDFDPYTGDNGDISRPNAPTQVSFGTGISQSDVTIQLYDGAVIFRVAGSGEIVFNTWSQAQAVQTEFLFADGSVWKSTNIDEALAAANGRQVRGNEVMGTTGNDTLTSSQSCEVIDGLGGTDKVTSQGGNDTFVFNKGYGSLEIFKLSSNGDARPNFIALGAGISESNLKVSSNNGSDLVLGLGTGGDQIRLDYALQYPESYGNDLLEFADGTTVTSSQLIHMATTGTQGSDVLYGSNGADVFDGHGGGDIENGAGGSDTFIYNKGYGHLEIVESYNSGDRPVLQIGSGITQSTLTVAIAGNGNDLIVGDGISGDQITLDYMTIANNGIAQLVFADGSTMSASDLIKKAHEIDGSTGSDDLSGTVGADLFDGKGGGDVESGGGGSDTFVFNKGYGQLEIVESYNSGDQPVLQFGAGITANTLAVRASDDQNSIVITDGASGDQITIDYMLSIADDGVTSVRFADGSSLSAQQLILMETTGTTGADTLIGTSSADVFDGKGGGDLAVGNGGNDSFVFNQGYGALEINESDSSTKHANVLALGTGITTSTITASFDGAGNLLVGDGISGDLIQLDGMGFESWTTKSASGIQSVSFADGTVWTAQQLETFAHTFTGTTGSDTLTGTSKADFFDGKGGGDLETGAGGNDTFFFAKGYGALEISEADSNSKRANVLQLGAGLTSSNLKVGHDTAGTGIVITDGTAGDKITLDTMLSTATGGVQTLMFADGTSLTRAQLILLETTGTTGADSLYGTSGADSFDGHGGADLEVGRGGNDTFIFNKGYGHLEITESDSSASRNNILQLGTGISASAVQVTHNTAGTGVVMTDGVTGDQITVDTMISSATGGVQAVQFADGTTWSRAQILQMETTGTTAADTLYGTTGADVFDGKGGADTEKGAGGVDTYSLASGYGALTIVNGVSSSNTAAGTLAIATENPNNIWLRQVGNNLEVDIMGTKTEATIQGWFTNNYSKLSGVKVSGGSGGPMAVDTQITQLIQAMATYSSNHTGFDPTAAANPQITDSTVLSAVSSAWHTST